jgi:hypothetical protein
LNLSSPSNLIPTRGVTCLTTDGAATDHPVKAPLPQGGLLPKLRFLPQGQPRGIAESANGIAHDRFRWFAGLCGRRRQMDDEPPTNIFQFPGMKSEAGGSAAVDEIFKAGEFLDKHGQAMCDGVQNLPDFALNDMLKKLKQLRALATNLIDLMEIEKESRPKV